MKPTANPALRLKLPVGRSRFVVGGILLAFAGLCGRAFYLQIMQDEWLQQKGASAYTRVITLPAHRGIIADRHGEPLAVSAPAESVFVSPGDVNMGDDERRNLAKLLGMDHQEIAKRLAVHDREFVYLKRRLPPETAAEVVRMNLSGVFLKREYNRFYPAGEVSAQLLGISDVDDRGQEGMELAYQNWLKGAPGSRHVIRDRKGRIVEDVEKLRPPRNGRDLTLSIDSKLQYLAYRELRAAVSKHKAKAGAIVVLDVKTGEVLALANVPTFNPNNREKLDRERTRNRAVTDLFEPGSTLKPFTVAAALEAGSVEPETLVETGPGVLQVGNRQIHDAHPEGLLTVSQVIQKSSNVGIAKIAFGFPAEKLWGVLSGAGFGTLPGSGFPGEAGGILWPYRSWKPIQHATISFGHGISVSLVQLARAYTLFATGGQLQPLHLLRHDEPVAGRQVISARTANTVRQMMESVVSADGTAVLARVAGYRVAGKTGTAHKIENKGYSAHRYVASFVGLAPVSDPRLIVAVMIDEPGGHEYYGGQVAAPVFSEVMGAALRALGVAPDDFLGPGLGVQAALPKEKA
ncbi:MAG: peptidoglycan D,D-transpeptidase FtsI family protein [Burkholderiales bacterium]